MPEPKSDSETDQPTQWIDGIYDDESEKISVPYIETIEALQTLDPNKKELYDQWISKNPEALIEELQKLEKEAEKNNSKLTNQQKIQYILTRYSKPPASFKVIPPDKEFSVDDIPNSNLSSDDSNADFMKTFLGYLADFVNYPYIVDEFKEDHTSRADWRVKMASIFGKDFFKLYEQNKFKWNAVGHVTEQLNYLKEFFEKDDQKAFIQQVIVQIEKVLAPSRLKDLDFSRLDDPDYMTHEKYGQYRAIQERFYKKQTNERKKEISTAVNEIVLNYLNRLAQG